MTTTTRQIAAYKVSGTYTRAQLAGLLRPIAWHCASPEERAQYEAARALLVAEARAALDSDPTADAVEIVDGAVAALLDCAEPGGED